MPVLSIEELSARLFNRAEQPAHHVEAGRHAFVRVAPLGDPKANP